MHYKRNGKMSWSLNMNMPSYLTTIPRPHGPFESCGGCPYASHGFMCYTSEGNCLKTDMEKLNQKRKAVTVHA